MKEMLVLFFTVAITDFFAEMGDKTQFMLIGLSGKYKLRDVIIGTLSAIIILNGIAVFAGGIFSVFIPDWVIKFIASAAFFYFGITSLLRIADDDENAKESKIKIASLAVFCTFFIAELGDKTQLTAITFGANGGLAKAFVIWAACVVGFFAADIIGMLIGLLLKKKLPEGFLNIISYVLFSFFGFSTLNEALNLLQVFISKKSTELESVEVPKILIFALVSIVFVFLSVLAFLARRKKLNKVAVGENIAKKE